jgi:hypothetical protein
MAYAKAIIAMIVSAAGAAVTVLGPGNQNLGDLSLKQWLMIVAAVLASGGLVWLTQNGPWHPYIKSVVAFLSAGVASLIGALDDNVITQAEWLTAFSAAVVATGLVFQIANRPRSI